MRFDRILTAALVAFLGSTSNATGFFVIELRDGRRLEANFVRTDGDRVFASRASGEIQIGRGQVLSIHEVEPGRSIDETTATKPVPAEPAAPKTTATRATQLSVAEIREKDRAVTREIILGHREQLFARLRGDDPASMEKRRAEIETLERSRAELRDALPSWERSN